MIIERFQSLADLTDAHDRLLDERERGRARVGDDDLPAEFILRVQDLIVRGRATGAVLDGSRERRAAQGVTGLLGERIIPPRGTPGADSPRRIRSGP